MTCILKEDKEAQKDSESDVEAWWAHLSNQFTWSGIYINLFYVRGKERLVDAVVK